MSCCDVTGLRSITDALTLMRQCSPATTQVIERDLYSANGDVLAEDVISTINVPPADNSAMDGYALNVVGCKPTTLFTIVATVLAGQIYCDTLKSGECVRIMTGAVIPQGTSCVVMQERANRHENTVSFEDTFDEGAHIRRMGEDIAIGNVILEKGCVLGPAQLGVLASIGQGSVSVYRPLKIAVFATGDELQPAGAPLQAGNIYESNRIVCLSKLSNLGCDVIDYGIIKDCPIAIKRALDEASKQCDVIITSGGVSVGEADYVKDVLSEHGNIDFWKLAIKPGKPFAFGQYKQATFFGLPGNPVATYVTLDMLTIPTLKKMAGHKVVEPMQLQAKSLSRMTKSAGRVEFQRGTVQCDGQQLTVHTSKKQGSHMMTSLTDSNAYIVLENEQTTVNIGDTIQVLLYTNII